jgi:hypothetical protein
VVKLIWLARKASNFQPAVLETAALPIELLTNKLGAANRVRTDDVLLGKQVLYQLSYSRIKLFYYIAVYIVTNLVDRERIELSTPACKASVIPFN